MNLIREYLIKVLTALGGMSHPQGKGAEEGVMTMRTDVRHELTSEGWWRIIPYMDYTYKTGKIHPYICRCSKTHLEWTGYRMVCINCFGAQGKTVPIESNTLDIKEYLTKYPSLSGVYLASLTPNYNPNCTFGDNEGMILGLPDDDGFIPVLMRQYKDIGGTMVTRPKAPYDQIVRVKDETLTITKMDPNVVELIYDNNCKVVKYEGNCITESFSGTILDTKGQYVLVLSAPDKRIWCHINSIVFTKFDETVDINYE